ncbi:hypothetical protein WJX84_001483 [Apatococcus fuscideae]|uniref:Pre-mRNA-splicing factor Syf1-like N-terminal HAT-repeats domain-containing protein n=1 Tax=Apatococcus fuscideae TaxID=2026836 RepID=A0AAW1SRH9_9CHLO
MVPAIPSEASTSGLESLLPSDEDLLYEEELLRNPYSLKMWWRYLEARKEAPTQKRHLLYERALKALPGSYKLWYAYLRERGLAVRGLPPQHRMWEGLVDTYERAMVSMHKMPRMWIDFLQLLVDLRWVTKTRRAFDRALCALPITQHDRIWQMFLKFVMQPSMPSETAFRVYRRYLKLEPTHTEEFIAYLRSRERWGEAARKLAEIVDNDMFR